MLTLPTLAAEPIFNIGNFTVTNTYINSTLTVVFFLVLAFVVKSSIKTIPRGIQNFFEMLLETIYEYMDRVTGDRKKSEKILPIAGALFLFILVSNWLGLLPGIGSIGINRHNEFIPIFRPANTDLNMTLAMAVLGVTLSHFIGIMTIGFFKYANKFIKLADLYHGLKSLKFDKMFTAIVEFGVGLIEIISEISKMVSLSLRLFGNVFAGEVLLTVIAGIFAYAVPLPFIALELLVGLIQAVVFAMLILVYVSIAMTPPAHAEAHH